jgi:hypothetical protein
MFGGVMAVLDPCRIVGVVSLVNIHFKDSSLLGKERRKSHNSYHDIQPRHGLTRLVEFIQVASMSDPTFPQEQKYGR